MAKASPGRGGSASQGAFKPSTARKPAAAAPETAGGEKAGSGQRGCKKGRCEKGRSEAGGWEEGCGKGEAAGHGQDATARPGCREADGKAASGETIAFGKEGAGEESRPVGSGESGGGDQSRAAPTEGAGRNAHPLSAARPPCPGGAKGAFSPADRRPGSAGFHRQPSAGSRLQGGRTAVVWALYRDLGIAAATAGLARAHVIRFVPPCTDAVRKRHLHRTDLQLVYVLKGWIKNEFEGHGEQMMSTGSCWLQPSGIEHTVLDYSPDCEVLEIIVPADFPTEDAG